jgi:triosephosphate isomerase
MKLNLFSFISLVAGSSAFLQSPNNGFKVMESTRLFERKPFITGNWKLNPQTKDEAILLGSNIASKITPDSPEVALFVPFPFIDCVQKVVYDKLEIGAESCTPELSGAFTGGISPPMLDSCGVKWALAGHSERRTINEESDEYINEQCVKLIEQGMSVILCIGETLSEFEADLAGGVCEVQLKKGLAGISAADMSRVCIAYEPVWAIGTGKVATPEIAQDVHAKCRSILSSMYGQAVADEVRILYGGSVSPESVDGLLTKPDIDGALVGGASLNADSFGRIINFQPVDALQVSSKQSKRQRFAKKVKTLVGL